MFFYTVQFARREFVDFGCGEMSFPDIEKWSENFSHRHGLNWHEEKIITESESF